MRHFLLYLLLSVAALSTHAQVKLALSAGAGTSFVMGKGNTAHFSPLTSLAGNASLYIPVKKNVILEIGLGYEKRGFKSSTTLTEGNYRQEFRGKFVYHYLTIPMQLSVLILQHGKNAWYAGGGFNYGIMVDAKRELEQSVYLRGQYIDGSSIVYHPKIGLVPPSNNSPNPNPKSFDVFVFDVAVKAHITYRFNNRYLLRASYGYSLYDINVPDKIMSGSNTHLNVAAITAGIIL